MIFKFLLPHPFETTLPLLSHADADATLYSSSTFNRRPTKLLPAPDEASSAEAHLSRRPDQPTPIFSDAHLQPTPTFSRPPTNTFSRRPPSTDGRPSSSTDARTPNFRRRPTPYTHHGRRTHHGLPTHPRPNHPVQR